VLTQSEIGSDMLKVLIVCLFVAGVRTQNTTVHPKPFVGIVPPILINSSLFKSSNSTHSKVENEKKSNFSTMDFVPAPFSANLPDVMSLSNRNLTAANVTNLSLALNSSMKSFNVSCSSAYNSTVEPEKCCTFPDLFPDEIVDKCEKDFGMNVSSVNNDFLADSVISNSFRFDGIPKIFSILPVCHRMRFQPNWPEDKG
jgi:hypothetical protein